MDPVSMTGLAGAVGVLLGALGASVAVSRRYHRQLAQERAATARVREHVAAAEDKLRGAFRSLSALALRDSSHPLVEALRFHRRSNACAAASPIHESLAVLAEQIRELSASCSTWRVVAEEDVLDDERAKVLKALVPSEPGRWARVQLDRVLEAAGLSEDGEILKRTDDGAELMLRLPAGGAVIVDARVPLDAFLESLSLTGPATRSAKLVEHARAVDQHVAHLGSEEYRGKMPEPPKAVVLFLPGEIFFTSALEHQPMILNNGARAGVVFATPTMLLAVLRTIRHAWKEDRLLANLQRVRDEGGAICDQVTTLEGILTELGNGLRRVHNAWEGATGLIGERMRPSAETLRGIALFEETAQPPGSAPPEVCDPQPSSAPGMVAEPSGRSTWPVAGPPARPSSLPGMVAAVQPPAAPREAELAPTAAAPPSPADGGDDHEPVPGTAPLHALGARPTSNTTGRTEKEELLWNDS